MSDIDPRDFGRLEAEVNALTELVKQQSADIAAIKATLSEARGGWRTLLLVGGAASSAGGLLTWLMQNLAWKATP